MNEEKEVTLRDGRVFKGSVVLDTEESLDLVWVDEGVNHQVCIPKSKIVDDGS